MRRKGQKLIIYSSYIGMESVRSYSSYTSRKTSTLLLVGKSGILNDGKLSDDVSGMGSGL
ncbi:MAG: hypothetical protein GX235_12995 [Clostridiales bacterium]|nr:hypothetical protein [Clostridiales bacterium]